MEIVDRRLNELRAEADRARLAKRSVEQVPGEVMIAVSGRHIHLGSVVIVFGRMLREEGSHI